MKGLPDWHDASVSCYPEPTTRCLQASHRQHLGFQGYEKRTTWPMASHPIQMCCRSRGSGPWLLPNKDSPVAPPHRRGACYENTWDSPTREFRPKLANRLALLEEPESSCWFWPHTCMQIRSIQLRHTYKGQWAIDLQAWTFPTQLGRPLPPNKLSLAAPRHGKAGYHEHWKLRPIAYLKCLISCVAEATFKVWGLGCFARACHTRKHTEKAEARTSKEACTA